MKAKPALEKANIDVKTRNKGLLKVIGGSQSDTFNNVVCNQALGSLRIPGDGGPGWLEEQQMATLMAMKAFKPQDEIEGMLASQAVGLHNAVMSCLRLAGIPEVVRAAGRCHRWLDHPEMQMMPSGAVHSTPPLARKPEGKHTRNVRLWPEKPEPVSRRC